MKYAYLIKIIFGRANLGLIQTNVVVVNGTGEYDGDVAIMKEGETDFEKGLIIDGGEMLPNEILGNEETEYMLGNDLEEMIQIFKEESLDLYGEDMSDSFEKMKKNVNVEIDLDV